MRPAPGRPKQVSDLDIVDATLSRPPKKYGVTHWSSRLLGQHLGLGNATVSRAWRAWRAYGVHPWKAETFTFSTDPELVAKVTDVVGKVPGPAGQRDRAVSRREVPDPGALDRTAPMLPVRTGDAEKRTHDDKRHGTTTLFAALEVATGQVTAAVKPKHRRAEFLSFLRQIDRAYPEWQLHLVIDNYATHKTPEVRDWLADRPRFHVHVTPTSGSWLNLVEVWFGIIDGQAIKRGVFTLVSRA
jgi:transposase